MSICSRLPKKGSPRGPGRSASSLTRCACRSTDGSPNGTEGEYPVDRWPPSLSGIADCTVSPLLVKQRHEVFRIRRGQSIRNIPVGRLGRWAATEPLMTPPGRLRRSPSGRSRPCPIPTAFDATDPLLPLSFALPTAAMPRLRTLWNGEAGGDSILFVDSLRAGDTV